MSDNVLNSLSEVLRQQLTSNSEKPTNGDKKMSEENNAQQPQTNQPSSKAEAQAEVVVQVVDSPVPTKEETAESNRTLIQAVMEEFGADGQPRILHVTPKILVTLTPASAEYPKQFERKGKHFSLYSPLRKGDGSAKNPFGFLRTPLTKLFKYASEVSTERMILVGSDAAKACEFVVDQMQDTADGFVYSRFQVEDIDGFQTPVIEWEEETEVEQQVAASSEEDEDLVEEEGEVEVSTQTTTVRMPARNLVKVDVRPRISRDGNAMVLEAMISVNVVVPIVYDSADQVKTISSIVKVINGYAKNSGFGEENVRVAVTMSTDELLSPGSVEILQHVRELLAPPVSEAGTPIEDEEEEIITAENNRVGLVTVGYITGFIGGEGDSLDILYSEQSLDTAVERMFPYGGDLLAVLQ